MNFRLTNYLYSVLNFNIWIVISGKVPSCWDTKIKLKISPKWQFYKRRFFILLNIEYTNSYEPVKLMFRAVVCNKLLVITVTKDNHEKSDTD